MKHLFFFILFTSFICASAQEVPKDTLRELNFSKEQRSSWDSLETDWAQKYFNLFLKKNKIKVSCSGCERVMFGVYFEIDSAGTCIPTLMWSKKCGTDFTMKQKADLHKILTRFKFPSPLHNTNIKVMMGRALKC